MTGDDGHRRPDGGATPHIGHEHADVTGGWLRPAVFGAMDGLVSNMALVSGVAAGSDNTQAVVLAGLAGLAAGAFSMAAGEYTSVASQRELAEAELATERVELRRNAAAEEAELAAAYVARGLDPQLARQVAHQLHRDPDRALVAHAQEELGIDPHSLPSARVAAASSFLAFSIGALVPVLPYLLGADALALSVGLSLVALFLCGAAVTRVTSRSWWYGGLRQLVLGAGAAALTYGFGTLVGAGLG